MHPSRNLPRAALVLALGLTACAPANERPAECSDYVGEAPEAGVDITFANTTDAAVYLDWYFGVPPVALDTPVGAGSLAPPAGPSCAAIVSPGADTSCVTGHPISQALRIDPGAEYTYRWDGSLYELRPVPLECMHPDDADQWPCDLIETCWVAMAPASGDYTATVRAFPSVTIGPHGLHEDCDDPACIETMRSSTATRSRSRQPSACRPPA